ncbi:MAG: peroxiredoxin-like family protein [bacterium]
MTYAAGDQAPDFSFSDHTGKQWSYPADFSSGNLALFFLRHLGCPLCKDKIEELKNGWQSFQDKSITLAAVVQSTPKRAASYAERAGIPFLLVPDREKSLYELFGLRRGGAREYMTPSVMGATIRATFKGHMHGRFEGDEFQMPGAFLLSPDGKVLRAHYGKNVSDFGDVSLFLA